jgi:hypothetical protein
VERWRASTYKPLPSLPLNALLISSSCNAWAAVWMSGDVCARRNERGDVRGSRRLTTTALHAAQQNLGLATNRVSSGCGSDMTIAFAVGGCGPDANGDGSTWARWRVQAGNRETVASTGEQRGRRSDQTASDSVRQHRTASDSTRWHQALPNGWLGG